MKKNNLLICVFFFVLSSSFAQGIYTLKFASQLLESQQNEYADWVLTEIEDSLKNSVTSSEFYYYKGLLNYRFKAFEASNKYLSFIPDDDMYSTKSLMMQVVNYAYLKDYSTMIDVGESMHKNTYRNFSLSSAYLLNGEYELYDTYRFKTDTTSYLLSQHIKRIDVLAKLKRDLKQKSPLMAGIYSAIVPGLGKVYTGDYGSGISAFFTNAALGAMVYENYRKDGLKDAKTLFFAGLFSVFYVGNIWGSVMNVRVHNQVLIDGINEQILLEIHIPLRNVFNTL